MAKKSKSDESPITEALREAIDGCGISRYELHLRTGVSQAVLSLFMSRKRDLRLATVDQLAKVLGLKLIQRGKLKGRPEGA
jgi:transcriptional regulator with XRE-family HTH domain